MKIAIIGTGIAGLGAAYALSRPHDVELFEANGYAGGHANTVTHGSQELDTGFIVHNEANYPNLTRLFRELGVATQPSEMSFAMSCGCGLEWSSRRPWRAGPRLLREILEAIAEAVAGTRLQINGVEEIGFGYARTLREWRQNVWRKVDRIRELGYDDRFLRIWTFYLAYCEAGFAIRSLRDMQIVLTHPANDSLPEFPAVRPTF